MPPVKTPKAIRANIRLDVDEDDVSHKNKKSQSPLLKDLMQYMVHIYKTYNKNVLFIV